MGHDVAIGTRVAEVDAPEELDHPVRGGGKELVLHRPHGGGRVIDDVAAQCSPGDGVKRAGDARALVDALAAVGEVAPGALDLPPVVE
eukprot:7636454-Lingulodinium_polyedra.AAC.1